MEWGRLPPEGSMEGSPRLQDLLFSMLLRGFRFVRLCDERSRSDTERVATAFPLQGGMCCFFFSGLQL